MRSFLGTAFELDSFAIVDRPVPEPGPGQLRIRIAAAALGFVDGLMIQGRYQIKPPLPYVPGGEIAGVVDAVGRDVTSHAVGQSVVTWQLGGGLAEHVVVDAVEVDTVPDELSLPMAAAMLVDFQTAHYALFDQGRLTAADTLLVLGAGGAVASAAIQLAVHTGARVIAAAASEQKRDAAYELGAMQTIDYSLPNWREALKKVAPEGVDVVLDPVGASMLEPAFRSLAKGGRYLVVGFAGGAIPSLPVNLALLKNATLHGVDIRYFLASRPKLARRVRNALFAMAARGDLQPPATITFALENARCAVEAIYERDRRGKVLVLPRALAHEMQI
ncbi:NADPH:quinone oxidoreductase family protein [Paraburkholderia caribensis]|uniref:Alcohol dehydrogenase n=1 Tax=Paraburkholderia caribensis TaxID=75105 RepID=A0A9Q6WPR6_9BURK|nr:NADPH:quinone oxidoreductase family protein [Paraburkholderia caribensis]MCO4878291.1 NADPH:quinone oxidoreductase family protein [Paraburkholderia caribensis]PTB28705.1 alcohol dehydrogenase [Paraburkholderia caribensis]QLB66540.1 alcohol dehydrogenase [Paraburkholderia caribensis]